MSDSSIRRFPSPLRYPGGKGKIINYIKLLFLENDLVGTTYVEPYAGGASLALALLYEEYADRIHINDLNRSVHAFWEACLTNTEALCRRIHDTPVTMEEWKRQRDVQTAEDPDPLDLAFSTFFLNRTNRSGIIGAGVIGGNSQDGEWKLDARYNKTALIRRIEKVARYRNRITLTRLDAVDLLRDLAAQPSRALFFYLDPPYYVKGARLYQNFYRHDDHVLVADLVRSLPHPWLVSYDAAPEILELYQGYPRIMYKLAYSATNRYAGAEVMFFSRGLNPPSVPSPVGVRAEYVDRIRRQLVS